MTTYNSEFAQQLNVTKEVVKHWTEAYMIERQMDPHSDFAKRLGVDRNTAKVLCYKVIYVNPALRFVLRSGQEAQAYATNLRAERIIDNGGDLQTVMDMIQNEATKQGHSVNLARNQWLQTN